MGEGVTKREGATQAHRRTDKNEGKEGGCACEEDLSGREG